MIAGAARASIRYALASAACVLVFMLAGCSAQNFTPTPTPLPATSYYAPPRRIYGTSHTEVASWYGPGFAGRRTSTGEIYNPSGLTAASTSLPLGSHVRVTNPETGRSVVVRINDRGPFVRGRSLDLSHGAAQQIGLTGKGVGRVRVTPTASSTPAFSSITSTYSESSITTTSRNVREVSYSSRPRYVTVRRHHYRYTSSQRTVSNPFGAWLASAFQ
jgi:rare lipoprotein A